MSSERVPQIMEPKAGQFGLLQQLLQSSVCASWVHRPLRAEGIREDPLGQGRTFPFPQKLDSAVGEQDRPLSRIGLGFSCLQPSALSGVDRSPHLEGACLTLKQHPMTYEDLKDFIQCYHPENRYERHETWSQDNPDGRWRRFTAEEILNRDKTSLDIFWIKDKALADLDNLPAPEELAEDILENLQSAMDGFSELLDALKQ